MENIRAEFSTKDIIGFLYKESRSPNGGTNGEFISRLVSLIMELYLEASLIVSKEETQRAYSGMKAVLDRYFNDEKIDRDGDLGLGIKRGDAGPE